MSPAPLSCGEGKGHPEYCGSSFLLRWISDFFHIMNCFSLLHFFHIAGTVFHSRKHFLHLRDMEKFSEIPTRSYSIRSYVFLETYPSADTYIFPSIQTYFPCACTNDLYTKFVFHPYQSIFQRHDFLSINRSSFSNNMIFFPFHRSHF